MAGALLLMLIVGGGAGFIPARRASRIDPATALRQE
jgi:ABC-type antimicrobial peptide transport system permease subunit